MDKLLQQQGPEPISPSLAIAASGITSQKFPSGIRLINLRDGSKAPASPHGHHDAVPQDEFVQTGTNVGMVLDGGFLLVDIDDEDNDEARLLSERCLEMTPWEQKTPKGRHFLFRTPPECSLGNTKLRDKTGTIYGDIKASGYAVGPGSKVDGTFYEVVKNEEPPLAPQWLLSLAVKSDRASTNIEERSGIPYGEHDNFLVRLAGYLRSREGLTEDAIRGVLAGGPLGALASYDEAHPYTERDIARIARSAARWDTHHEEYVDLANPSIRPATDIALVGPTIEWVVRGFIPCGELVLMYGPGGIGKSSAGSWLCSEVTRQGKRFCYMGTEEPPARFFGRSVLAGANRERCFDVVNPAALKFPRDAKRVESLIQDARLDVLYIDSIYSHFEHKEGQNAAEKARDALAPLLAIAHGTGCTVFGVFHTNKAGAFLGSTEMENVARCLLEAKRKPKQSYLGIKVHKTNLYNPGKMMRLEGREEIFRDEQGNVQLERDEQGNEIPLKIIVPSRIEDVVDDEPEDAPMEFDQEDVKLSAKDRIRMCLADMGSALSNREVADQTGIPVGTVNRIRWEIGE